MPHVSSKKLNRELMHSLYDEFSEALEKSARKSWSRMFLREFLTKTEKIMLAKRFAVICMLHECVPVTYIAESLGMSPSTVQRMSLGYETGRYGTLLKTIGKKDNKEIWDILEEILRTGLPPRAGRGRWKFLYKK